MPTEASSKTPQKTPDMGSMPLAVASDGRLAQVFCFLGMLFQGMRSNRFQLVLTVMTMSIGSIALSLTLFLGEGALQRLWSDMETMMGSWVIAYYDAGIDQHLLQERARPEFTSGDLAYVARNVTQAKFVAPIYMSGQPIQYRDVTREMPLEGITETLGRENLYRPLKGTGMSPSAYRGLTWECLVTETAAAELQVRLEGDPVIIIHRQPFKIKGIVPDPPRVAKRFQGRVIVPYESARILWLSPGTIGNIIVGWKSAEDMQSVVLQLRQALDQCRGPKTYYLSSSQFSIEKSKNIVANFMAFGAAQAMFCIIVASVGVLNVMLTNVAHRMHEFSIRISMGATKNEILRSVVLESCLIAMLGALCGVVVAIISAPYLGHVISMRIPEAARLRPVYTFGGLVYPFVVCGICGLIAGVLPAIRVRRLDVLAALRLEA